MTSGPRYSPSKPALPLPPRGSRSPPTGGHCPHPVSGNPRSTGRGPLRPPRALPHYHHPYNHLPWWRSRPEWHLSPQPRPCGPLRRPLGPGPAPAHARPQTGGTGSAPSPPNASTGQTFSGLAGRAPMLPRLEPVLPDVLTMTDPTLPREAVAVPVNQLDKDVLAQLRLPALRTATVDRTESLLMHTQLRVHFIHV
ncbi:hypothetical protein H4R35_004824 [Dimargaris xerosporica]|nr:hypothetical protein H4R35_004824 [Dimargaris xerosporica]